MQELLRYKNSSDGINKEKKVFLANMSHELRTPINGIIGMTELVLDTNLNYEQREYLKMVKNSSHHLLGLINDILDFSRIEANRMVVEDVDFDLISTINITVEPFTVQALHKGIILNTEVSPNVPAFLRGDVGRLRQVLANLLSNALKFTDRGKIELKLDVAPATLKGRKLPVVSDNERLLLFCVSDTGIGIAEEMSDLIFESFTQDEVYITRKYNGMGLGLAIAKKVLYMLGGDIWVESALGKGSSFYFTARFLLQKLPGSTALKVDETDVKSRRVLLVNSNSSILSGMSDMIKSEGYSVDTAPNGQSALSILNSSRTAYDAAVLDLQITDMDGFELVRKIKSDMGLSSLKVIMIVAAGLRGDAALCRMLGVSGYLVKPVYKSDLLKILNMAIACGDGPVAQLLTCHTVRELRGPVNILVAEDNIVNQTLAVKLLQRRGYMPLVVGNGREAIRTLAHTNFDLVLMDVQMPEMDGLQATRYIRSTKDTKIKADIPIIAMTAHALKGDMEICLAAGMDDYISKPLRADDLYRLIEKYIASSSKDINKIPQETHLMTDVPEVQLKPEQSFPKPESVPDKLHISIQQPSTRTSAGALDIKETMQRLDNDEEILRDMWIAFVDDVPKQIALLRDLLDTGDVDELQKQVHLIQGVSANIGATALKSESLRIEIALKKLNKDLNDSEKAIISSFIEILQFELDMALKEINTNLAKPIGTIR
ncbi:MAG: response regulator [Nitrospirae bacterium YQR-1]